ncbi:hypothetical protein MRX96_042380 [Rhipicephalus microplus]
MVADCDAKPKKPVKPKAIPNLLQNYRDGWKLTAELNNADEKLTTYMVEYYNTETKQGFLSFKQNGLDDLNLFYISDTSELFVYQKGSCKVMDVQNPPDPGQIARSSVAKLASEFHDPGSFRALREGLASPEQRTVLPRSG